MTPDDLVVMEQIKQVKYRYLRCLDLKWWDELADVLCEDVVAEYSAGAYSFRGRDELLGFLKRGMGSEQVLSSHKCHHPEISLTSPTTAHGTWALDDTVLLLEFDLTVRGAAFYEDDYVLEDDGVWRIARTGYRRVYEEIQPRSAGSVPTVTASWWGTDGRSTLPAG